ncbi:ATP-binding protein [Sphingobium terrigena]|uniref:ATP-binding protein n=1 Tax=Sphingobium terrigena TaxID=2304063 RepID=UPI001602BB42|nr:ATP-binding protein [Sphingobium terrigena]
MNDHPPLKIPARLEAVAQLADYLRASCADAAVAPQAAIDLELALVEAANNIILHGYAGRSDGTIGLLVRQGEGVVELELTDFGLPMDDGQIMMCRPFSLDDESGRGIQIIQSCIDLIDYRRDAGVNCLAMTKFFDPPAPTDILSAG